MSAQKKKGKLHYPKSIITRTTSVLIDIYDNNLVGNYCMLRLRRLRHGSYGSLRLTAQCSKL